MRLRTKYNSLIVLLLSAFLTHNVSAQIDSEKVISQMTLEEKAKLVVGMGINFPGAPPGNEPAVGQTLDRVPGAAGSTYGIPRFGIPSIVVADGPAGLRIAPKREGDEKNTYYATAFPIATLLASTWDTVLIEEVGQAIGKEVLEYGVDIILMPALNLHRNPLCGRNFEYYTEDPYLNGKITAAMVNGIQSQGVGTSLKHYAANDQETNRRDINTIVSERTLRELYLKGFEIAVKKSNPWTIMSSYNKINGASASENYDLLTKIPREQWGFKGFVMSDWFAGKDPVAQMKAGNDLLMPGIKKQTDKIIAAVKNGSLDESILDRNIKRILDIISLTPSYKKYQYSNKPDLEKHAQIARKVGSEGMILLKNENEALPLSTNIIISLFGNSSYNLNIGGTGSGDVNEAYRISMEESLKNSGYVLDDSLKTIYVTYLEKAKAEQPKRVNFFFPQPPIPEMPVRSEMIKKTSTKSDVAVITLGRNSGEFSDRKLEDDFYLSAVEQELISQVSEAFHQNKKNVIVVLNIGGVIETYSWRDKVDAILLAWQPGQEGGNPITDVLSGKVNPSGKLATTFPIKYEDLSSAKNFPGVPAEKPQSVTYEEGIYVGYRYFITFDVKPAYEFGYGLSYTEFEYNNTDLDTDSFIDEINVKVDITNTGNRAGKEVVQLYISAPANKLEKPMFELKTFAKTRLLQPGESETLLFTITAQDLASYDSNSSSWIAEGGEYSILIGSSCVKIHETLKFDLHEELVVEELEPALVPLVEINELQK